MDNFARVLRLPLKHRWTLAGSLVCALMVAVLWGGNIGVIYPLMEVCVHKKSLVQWADEKIAESEGRMKEALDRQAASQARLPQADESERASIEGQIAVAQADHDWAESSLHRYQWLRGPIERYLPNDPFKTLVLIVVALLVGTVIKDCFLTLNSILVDRLANLTAFDMRKLFFRRTLRLELSRFTENGSSDLVSRFTNDLDGVTAGIQTFFGRMLLEPLKAIACLAVASWICWRLLVLSLIIAPLAAYLITTLAKTLKRANRRALELVSTLYGILLESFGGIKVVKAFTMERHERRRFHVASKQSYRRAMRISVLDSMVNPLTEVMGMLIIGLAIILGAYLAINAQTHLLGIRISSAPLDLGSLMTFFAMLIGTSDPARKLSEVFNRLQRAAAASDRVFELLDREPAIVNPRKPQEIAACHRELSFDRVSFHYYAGQSVLEDVSLSIRFGETVAIVGPNGCGKSTLANLVLRFFDPVSGSVRIDGVDVKDLRLRDLRSRIGLVTQETVLFDDTIANNIRYGSPRATREEIVAAAKQAHAHKFIEQKLESGYETRVGPQGSRLSGGQRQRIALARAILRDPAILILDEATSQIDLESEQLIHAVLEQFVRNRTTILITHRLASLALADRIVVMNAGRILDVGTHDHLLSRSDIYRRLHQIQFKESA